MMNQLDIVLYSIAQYTQQLSLSRSYAQKSFSLFGSYFGYSEGETRAQHLEEVLLAIKNYVPKNKDEQPDEEDWEVLDKGHLSQNQAKLNLKKVEEFIQAYIDKDKTKMTKIAQSIGPSGVYINYNLLLSGNDYIQSLRSIISYNLKVFNLLEPFKHTISEISFSKEAIKKKEPQTTEVPSQEKLNQLRSSTGGKNKFFDAKNGYVYARNSDIAKEFENEANLKKYITYQIEKFQLTNAVSNMFSFQEQDPEYPLRAKVDIYEKDHVNHFGYETLYDFINHAEERQYSYQQIMQVFNQLLDVTFQMSQMGIAHGDLHSQNIKILYDGNPNSKDTNALLQVFDFGLTKYGSELAKKDALIDWEYLLKRQATTYSDQVGRSFVDYLPIKTETSMKHYPIHHLLEIILGMNKSLHSQLCTIIDEHANYFINALTYKTTDDPQFLSYLYQNFKYRLNEEIDHAVNWSYALFNFSYSNFISK